MAGGQVRKWSIAQAWEAAVAVTAAAYGVDPASVRAQSRGRGPRPLSEIWEPRKMAVHLAVMAAGCSYAALGRVIGLHRDTIASHCADMRDQVLMEAQAESASIVLEKLVRARLQMAEAQRIDALRAHLAMLEAAASDLASGEAYPTDLAAAIGSSARYPTVLPTERAFKIEDHGNVIALVGTAKS